MQISSWNLDCRVRLSLSRANSEFVWIRQSSKSARLESWNFVISSFFFLLHSSQFNGKKVNGRMKKLSEKQFSRFFHSLDSNLMDSLEQAASQVAVNSREFHYCVVRTERHRSEIQFLMRDVNEERREESWSESESESTNRQDKVELCEKTSN